MILVVFSNPDDSKILWYKLKKRIIIVEQAKVPSLIHVISLTKINIRVPWKNNKQTSKKSYSILSYSIL